MGAYPGHYDSAEIEPAKVKGRWDLPHPLSCIMYGVLLLGGLLAVSYFIYRYYISCRLSEYSCMRSILSWRCHYLNFLSSFFYAPYQVLKRCGIKGPTPVPLFGNYRQAAKMVWLAPFFGGEGLGVLNSIFLAIDTKCYTCTCDQTLSSHVRVWLQVHESMVRLGATLISCPCTNMCIWSCT